MSTLKAVTAAGGVIFRKKSRDAQPEVLLIFRRGVWDLPKGKLEEGESIQKCAVREVTEEIGISEEPQVLAKLGDTYHEYEEQDTLFGKTTYWFAMTLSSPKEAVFHPQEVEGIEEVQWQTLEEAKKNVGYENLLEILKSFENWFKVYN